MKRVFITGASGFLGSYLLETAPANVQILAQFNRTKISTSKSPIKTAQIDFNNPNWHAVEEFQPEVIIHSAALASIDDCEKNPEIARTVNYTSTTQLIDLAMQMNARFLFVSTDQIYGGNEGNYSEKDSPQPLNVYAQTKIDAENYLLDQYRNAVSVRAALIYGTVVTGRPSFTEIMINNLREANSVNLFIDEYRSPIQVHNLATALWELAEHDYRGLLNLGGPQRVTRFEMGEIVCRLFGFSTDLLNPTQMADINLPATRPQDCSFDISLAQSLLKTELLNFTEGIKRSFQ